MSASDPGEHEAMLAALARPSAFPTDRGVSSAVERVDTHISHVFLTRHRVYKMRRPVKLTFLDFSTVEERNADCLREVALNRRLSPDVYLGLAPVLPDAERPGVFFIGEIAERLYDAPSTEHCVVMRRLPAGRDMKSLLAAGDIEARHVDAVAMRMADFHAAHRLDTVALADTRQWLDRTIAPARGNIEALLKTDGPGIARSEVESVAAAAEQFARSHASRFEQRLLRGRVVDGHGDLHCEHVWFETADSAPLMVDCLEFREDFRHIDAASDIAFLAMDLQYRGRADLAARLLRRYARHSGDYHLFSVVDFFLSYRAMVRAKVAALVATDESFGPDKRHGARESARAHLELGASFLTARAPGAVVLVSGTVGTGKTTVAEALADAMGGVVLSSDHIRKDRAGLPAAAREGRGTDQGMYEAEARAAVYAAMLEEADAVVASGRCAILDGTYARRSWRHDAAAWARARGVEAWLVEVTAPEALVLERLRHRAAAGEDASDAGPEHYALLTARMEEASEWMSQRRARVDTAGDWRGDVTQFAERVRRSAP
ncbi:MAG TPA: AAA family ATPase [Candidatus Binatia bacterium]|nr:AAA family ATPase [Candidatus Binatia bacterium]